MDDPQFKCHERIYADSEESEYFICRHCQMCFHKDRTIEHRETTPLASFYSLQRSEVTFYINRHIETREYFNKLRLLSL